MPWLTKLKLKVLCRKFLHNIIILFCQKLDQNKEIRVSNGHISTSGLKSDVTIVFLDPNFLKDKEISAIRVHLRQMHGVSGPRPKIGIYRGGKIGEGVVRYWPLTNSFFFFPFGGSYVCASFCENQSRNATVRVPTDGQIHTLSDWQTDRHKPNL